MNGRYTIDHRSSPRGQPMSPARRSTCTGPRNTSHDYTRPTSVTSPYSGVPPQAAFWSSHLPSMTASYRSSSAQAPQVNTQTPLSSNANSRLLSSPPRKKLSPYQQHSRQCLQSCGHRQSPGRGSDGNQRPLPSYSSWAQYQRSAYRPPSPYQTTHQGRQKFISTAYTSVRDPLTGATRPSQGATLGNTNTLQNSPWHISSNLASLAEYSTSFSSDNEAPRIYNHDCDALVTCTDVTNEHPNTFEDLEGNLLLRRCQPSKDTDATTHSSHTSQTGSNTHNNDEPPLPALPPGSMQSTKLMQYILGVLMTEKDPRPAKSVQNSSVYTLYKKN